MEHEYSVQLPLSKSNISVCPYHKKGTSDLQTIPITWTLEHDEDLAQFLCAHIELHNDTLGSIKNFVESVDVSTTSVSFTFMLFVCCKIYHTDIQELLGQNEAGDT